MEDDPAIEAEQTGQPEQREQDCRVEGPSVPPRYDAKIKKVENGFIVEVGCATFVSQDWKEISEGLRLYWEDPAKAQGKYCK